MVSFKLDKYDRMFIAFVFVIVTLFSFCQCFAAETEDVEYSTISNLEIDNEHNYFTSSEYRNVIYFEVEDGYIYHIKSNYSTIEMSLAYSDSVPAINVPYNFITTINPNASYSLIPNGDYVYLAISKGNANSFAITRERIEGMNDAIGGLVDNVGLNNFWGVFEGGIDFVGVVVLVAFGVFLLALAIKKISKGKSEF